MRKLIESTLVSADGVVADPPLWAMEYRDEEVDADALERFSSSDAMLMGRVTYELFALRPRSSRAGVARQRPDRRAQALGAPDPGRAWRAAVPRWRQDTAETDRGEGPRDGRRRSVLPARIRRTVAQKGTRARRKRRGQRMRYRCPRQHAAVAHTTSATAHQTRESLLAMTFNAACEYARSCGRSGYPCYSSGRFVDRRSTPFLVDLPALSASRLNQS